MIDTTTSKPLKVSKYGSARPFLSVPVSRIEDFRRLLDHHGIAYTKSEYAISLNHEPERVLVFIDDKVETSQLQAILDGVR